VQQYAIRHAAHVRAVDRAESGQGLVPRGPQVRGGRGGFGSNRIGRVMVAGQLAQAHRRPGNVLISGLV